MPDRRDGYHLHLHTPRMSGSSLGSKLGQSSISFRWAQSEAMGAVQIGLPDPKICRASPRRQHLISSMQSHLTSTIIALRLQEQLPQKASGCSNEQEGSSTHRTLAWTRRLSMEMVEMWVIDTPSHLVPAISNFCGLSCCLDSPADGSGAGSCSSHVCRQMPLN